MTQHHLILGQLTDFITGQVLADTHDERYRQALARLLVTDKGYRRTEIRVRRDLVVRAGEKRGRVPVDFIIHMAGRSCMLIKYGPGSLVTRHRPALAAARLVAPYQVPLAVVTNGLDASVLDSASGKVIATGLAGIPTRAELRRRVRNRRFVTVSDRRAEMEARILFCFEIDDSCPCDTTSCRL